MDSRLKKQVIAAAATMVAAVVVMVLVANYIQNGGSFREDASGQNADAQTTDVPATDVTGGTNPYGLDPHKDPYAYLGDEEFFDPVIEQADPAKTLSLLVSSVEKDMRVTVINGHGNLVTLLSCLKSAST